MSKKMIIPPIKPIPKLGTSEEVTFGVGNNLKIQDIQKKRVKSNKRVNPQIRTTLKPDIRKRFEFITRKLGMSMSEKAAEYIAEGLIAQEKRLNV